MVLPESGDDSPVAADDRGQVTWNNLPGEEGTLGVSAQGYFPAQQALSLERGPNEVTVALERDPYGLLPADACAAGENAGCTSKIFRMVKRKVGQSISAAGIQC